MLYCATAQDTNGCGDATPINTPMDRYLVDEYFCGIHLLRLISLDLVLVGDCDRF